MEILDEMMYFWGRQPNYREDFWVAVYNYEEKIRWAIYHILQKPDKECNEIYEVLYSLEPDVFLNVVKQIASMFAKENGGMCDKLALAYIRENIYRAAFMKFAESVEKGSSKNIDEIFFNITPEEWDQDEEYEDPNQNML